jgi:hypothetical protein
LNATGARVWALLQQALTRDEVVARLRDEFGDIEEIGATVDDLIEALRGEGLILG